MTNTIDEDNRLSSARRQAQQAYQRLNLAVLEAFKARQAGDGPATRYWERQRRLRQQAWQSACRTLEGLQAARQAEMRRREQVPIPPDLLEAALAQAKPGWYTGESVWLVAGWIYLSNHGGKVALHVVGYAPYLVVFYFNPGSGQWRPTYNLAERYRVWLAGYQARTGGAPDEPER